MKKLKFYGVSDDLFELEGDVNGEVGCYNTGGAYLLKSESGSMIVYANYAPPPLNVPTWIIGIALADEGKPLPDWKMEFVTAEANGYPNPQPYSPLLIIEAPDDVIVLEIQ